MDSRVTVGPIFDAFSVPATVTRPGEAPVETDVVWYPATAGGFAMADVDSHQVENMRAYRRRILALRVSDVPAVPPQTLIEAPEADGEAAQTWIVDEIAYVENDLIRVFVRPMKDDDYNAQWGR